MAGAFTWVDVDLPDDVEAARHKLAEVTLISVEDQICFFAGDKIASLRESLRSAP